MLLFLMDVDFGCDWILIQIFYAHGFVGKDADTCNQHTVAGITPATFKFVNYWLFIDQRRLDFFTFEIFSNFSRNEDRA